MNKIKLKILEYSYWEHFKAAKDISLIVSIDDPRRKSIENEINNIQAEISKLKR